MTDDVLMRLHLKTTEGADERVEGVRDAAELLIQELGAPGVKLTVRVPILCDSCGIESPTAATVTEALALAASLGWGHAPETGDDWCPSCWQAAKP